MVEEKACLFHAASKCVVYGVVVVCEISGDKTIYPCTTKCKVTLSFTAH